MMNFLYLKVSFTFPDPFDLSVKNFTIEFLQDVVCHSSVIPTSCSDRECNQVFELPLSSCNSSHGVSVTVSASNRLVTGPPTEEVNISKDNARHVVHQQSNSPMCVCCR